MSVRLLAEITSGALALAGLPSSTRMVVYSISDMGLTFPRDCCSENCSPNLPLSQGPDKSPEAQKKGDPHGSPLFWAIPAFREKLLSKDAICRGLPFPCPARACRGGHAAGCADQGIRGQSFPLQPDRRWWNFPGRAALSASQRAGHAKALPWR